MSAIMFTIPEVVAHLLTKHKEPLAVITQAWTAEGHPNGKSTIVSYAVDLNANHGITDAGVASFRFDVPVEEFQAAVLEGRTLDLRGHVPQRT